MNFIQISFVMLTMLESEIQSQAGLWDIFHLGPLPNQFASEEQTGEVIVFSGTWFLVLICKDLMYFDENSFWKIK